MRGGRGEMAEIFLRVGLKICYNRENVEAGDSMSKGRQYQDSVFRMYFNNEDRLRELAGALHGCVYVGDGARDCHP